MMCHRKRNLQSAAIDGDEGNITKEHTIGSDILKGMSCTINQLYSSMCMTVSVFDVKK